MSNDFVAPEAPSNYVSNPGDIQLPAAPPAKSGVGGGARVMIQTPQGQTVDRTTYIRALAKGGWTRGQIVTHIQEITGEKNFRYQAVFSVTKDLYAKRGAGAATHSQPVAPEAPATTTVEEQPAV